MSFRFVCILALIALGCSTNQGEQVQARPVSAASDGEACMMLVGGERFREAIPVCRRAQKAAPSDPRIIGALEYAERAR